MHNCDLRIQKRIRLRVTNEHRTATKHGKQMQQISHFSPHNFVKSTCIFLTVGENKKF